MPVLPRAVTVAWVLQPEVVVEQAQVSVPQSAPAAVARVLQQGAAALVQARVSVPQSARVAVASV